jgi:H+/Cl- antiporter ClcA
MLVRRSALAVAIGILAGLSSAFFLVALDWATTTRETNGWLLYLLPVAGLAVGLAYHHVGKGSEAGNNLVLDEIHDPQAWIPRRMAPLVLAGTIATQLFGGSAGREGTAIQMSGSLADGVNRRLGIDGEDRRVLLLAAIGGGFSAVFGVPAAGFVFALEVQAVGWRMRVAAALPVLISALVGNAVVIGLGVDHTPYPTLTDLSIDGALVLKVAVAGVVFGAMSVAFAEASHRTRRLLARFIAWPPARPVLGGLVVIALTALVGTRAYLGLSLPLLEAATAGGTGVALGAFAWKALFTVVTLGSGFQGGEVTPLFVIGATLGITVADVLDAPPALFACLGLVAVFAGATNTPLACTVLGVELFGPQPLALIALACAVAYLCSGTGGIYPSQRHHRFGFGSEPVAAPQGGG